MRPRGRTHLAHTAEHAVDLETRAIVGVTVQDAHTGDTTTMVETLITAAEQTGVGTPRSLQGRAAAAFGELIGLLAGCWGLLSHSWAPKPRDPSDAFCGSPATRQHAHMILNLRIALSTTGC